MVKVLSIDPGLTNFGWAISEYDTKTGKFKVLKYGIICPIKSANKEKLLVEKYGQRIITVSILEKELSNLIDSFSPEYIVSEDIFYNPGRPTAYLSLSTCLHTVERLSFKNHQRLFKIPPRSIKFTICGTGDGGKKAIQDSIIENANIELNKSPSDPLEMKEHEADAIGCGYTFCTTILPSLIK